MADTVGYNDDKMERSWRSGVTLAAQLQSYLFNFTGGDDDSMAAVPVLPRSAKRGDQITVRFSDINHDEEPKTRMGQVLGAESSTPYYEDNLYLRYFLFDGAIENVASDQQHVSFDMKKGVVERITRQWAYLWDKWWIYQGVGYTPANTADDYGLSGGNVVTAQDSDHILYAGTGNTTDATVAADTTAVMTTRLIDEALHRATSRDYVQFPMAPCTTPWGELYVLLVHGEGWDQLRENSSDSDFYDLSKAEIQGGGGFGTNPLISGEGSIHNNCLILKSDFLPAGVTADAAQANSKRALLFGARGWHMAFGDGFSGDDHLGWSEHMQHRRWSALADTVCGLKRTIVNGESWGTFTIVHYSNV